MIRRLLESAPRAGSLVRLEFVAPAFVSLPLNLQSALAFILCQFCPLKAGSRFGS